MEIWLQAIGEYGFPITVTYYLLYRMEKKLDMINRSIISLASGHALPAEEPALREKHLH